MPESHCPNWIHPPGGLGTFFWEPAGYSPFTGYNMTAWTSNRRPTVAMDGFLNV